MKRLQTRETGWLATKLTTFWSSSCSYEANIGKYLPNAGLQYVSQSMRVVLQVREVRFGRTEDGINDLCSQVDEEKCLLSQQADSYLCQQRVVGKKRALLL